MRDLRADLHARRHCDGLAGVMRDVGYRSFMRSDFMRSDQDVVLGHELAGVVAEHGPRTRGRLAVGTPVISLPLIRRDGAVDGLGLSAAAPGGYAEQVVVQESVTLAVPNGLSPDTAVLTEPLAMAWHAVNRGKVGKRDVAVVIGRGPVGSAVICLLKARGVRTVVAGDREPRAARQDRHRPAAAGQRGRQPLTGVTWPHPVPLGATRDWLQESSPMMSRTVRRLRPRGADGTEAGPG